MWIALNDAFLSVVSSDRDPAVLNVRARRPGDLERYFPGHTVHAWPGHDYAYRAFVPRDEVAAGMAESLRTICYTNFKGFVADDRLHDAYLRVWAIMAELQSGTRDVASER